MRPNDSSGGTVADPDGVEHTVREGTRDGALVGTLGYMSPEQVAGRVSAVGPPSDVWALGCVLYEMCTLKHPFDAKNQVMGNKQPPLRYVTLRNRTV